MERRGPVTAVVVDEWPLVRLGMVQALRTLNITVVAQAGQADEGVRRCLAEQVGLLVLGAVRDGTVTDAVRRARSGPAPPAVVVLLEHTNQDDLVALLGAGADAVLVRSASPEDVAEAVTRVGSGERVVAPALLALLMGVLGPPAGGAGGGGDGAGGPLPGAGAGPLTRKELEVLAHLGEGRSNRQIADALFVTPATVKTHLAHIYAKLGVTGRHQALARAVALGLLGSAPPPAR